MQTDAVVAIARAEPEAGPRWRLWWRGLRVRDWAHFALLPLASAPLGGLDATTLTALARGIAVATLVLAYGYLLNGLSDRKLDADATKNPFTHAAPRALETLLVVALALGALVLSVHGGRVPVLATTTSVIAGWLYSAGPRLKRLPFVGTLLNVACFAPLLLVGVVGGQLPTALPLLLCAFVGLLLENQLLHEAADATEDAAGRVNTTFLALGARGAALLAALVGALPAVALALALPTPFGVILAATMAVVFVVVVPRALARHGKDARRMSRIRLVHRGAGLALGALLFFVANR